MNTEHETARGNGQVTTGQSFKEQPETTDYNDRFNQKISVFKNAKGTKPIAEITLEDFVAEVRDGAHKGKIERLRAEPDEDEQSVLKGQLNAVSLSGRVTSGGRKKAMEEGRFAHSGYLQIDIDEDDMNGQSVEEIRARLRGDQHFRTAFRSPRGNGVKAVMLVPPAVTKDEHTATFLSAEGYMLATYKLKVDTATKDPVRMFFASYDPDAWWNENAVPLDTSRTYAAPPPKKTSKASKTYTGTKVGANVNFPEPPHEGIHAWLMVAAWHCRRNGLDELATIAKLAAYDGTLRRPYQPNEVEDAVHAVFTASTTQKSGSGIPEDRIAFSPMDVFYDGPTGKYLVDAGDYFRTLGRKSPVVTGVIRHFKSLGCDDKEAKEAARNEIADAEIDRHVEWSGNLAGHKKGLMESVDGKPMLVLTSPAIPEPITGPCPVILGIIRQAFPDDTQRNVFLGWVSGSYLAVRAGQHHAAPMLVLAGKINAGKSLLALVVKYVIGGRTANPHAAWSGNMAWNDDLFGSELLLLDDCTGSTDIRSRINFAASFKESIYAGDVQLRKRHTTSMSARPVWRVMVCCNDNAESLLIIPPIGTDMMDKIALLQVSKVTPPVDASNLEGKAKLRAMIEEELPAFAAILSRFEIPEELRDSRAGITAWRHPELAAALESTKPEHRLEELLETSIRVSYHLWQDLPTTLKASEIEGRLLDKDSPVREQSKTLFGTWSVACGTFLGRLADGGSDIVKRGDIDGHRKIGSYLVSRP